MPNPATLYLLGGLSTCSSSFHQWHLRMGMGNARRSIACPVASTMISLFDRQILFFRGKGGVGKTTCSSAFARWASAPRPAECCWVLARIPPTRRPISFEQPVGPDRREIQPRLWAIRNRRVARVSQVASRSQAGYRAHVRARSRHRQAYRQIDIGRLLARSDAVRRILDVA